MTLRPSRLAPFSGALLAALLASGCADDPPTAAASATTAATPEAPGGATAVGGQLIYGVDDRNTLVVFDATRPGELLRRVQITAGEGIIGIDFRPNDATRANGNQTGLLYGVGLAGRIYLIDPVTGTASGTDVQVRVPRFETSEGLMAGANVGIGFNPAADRLRVHTDSGRNLRLSVEGGETTSDGQLAYAPGDVNFGRRPAVVATAYTNSVNPAPAATQLYAIDVAQDVLVRLDSPNNGQLTTVGRLGVDNGTQVGFDIPGHASDRTGYATFTPPRGTRSFLYRINLDDAARQPVAPIGHDRAIISIAVDDADAAAPALSRYVIPGDAVFPEGVAFDAAERTFYVGSTTDGTIYRASLRDTVAATILPGGREGRNTAIGLKLDRAGRLYVAGGATGSVFIYNVRSNAFPVLVAVQTRGSGTGPTFVNDLAITTAGRAYVTDSQDPVIYRIEAGVAGSLPRPLERWLPLAGTAITYRAGFNLNGIAVTADDRYLLTVQSNTGQLFRVTIADRSIREVSVSGATLTNGDGILLDGQTLYVVRNQNGQIVKLQLDADFTAATAVGTTTDPSFAYPTTIAQAAGRLLIVNSQFNRRGPGLTPSLPFTVSSIPLP